jgi:hypothetical protein
LSCRPPRTKYKLRNAPGLRCRRVPEGNPPVPSRDRAILCCTRPCGSSNGRRRTYTYVLASRTVRESPPVFLQGVALCPDQARGPSLPTESRRLVARVPPKRGHPKPGADRLHAALSGWPLALGATLLARGHPASRLCWPGTGSRDSLCIGTRAKGAWCPKLSGAFRD